MAMFPTKEVFDKEMEKIEAKAIPWKELKVDEIYRIEEKMEVLTGKFGPAFILRVSNDNGDSLKVWATSVIARDLDTKKLPIFIRPRGLKVCKKDKNRSYQAFQLLSAEAINC